jgi:hypothetical protein
LHVTEVCSLCLELVFFPATIISSTIKYHSFNLFKF